MKIKHTFILAGALALTGLAYADQPRKFLQLDETEIGSEGTPLGKNEQDSLFVLYDNHAIDKDIKTVADLQPWTFGRWQNYNNNEQTLLQGLFTDNHNLQKNDQRLANLTTEIATEKTRHKIKRYIASIATGVGTMGLVGIGLGKLAHLSFNAFTNFLPDLQKHQKIGSAFGFGAVALVTAGVAGYVAAQIAWSQYGKSKKLPELKKQANAANKKINKVLFTAYQQHREIPLTSNQMKYIFPTDILEQRKGLRAYRLRQQTNTFLDALPAVEQIIDDQPSNGLRIPGQTRRVSKDRSNLYRRIFAAPAVITPAHAIPYYEV